MEKGEPEHSQRVIALAGVRNVFAYHLLRQLPQLGHVRKIIAIDVAPLSAQQPQLFAHPNIMPVHLDITHPSSDGRLASLLQEESVDTLLHLAFLKQPVFDTIWSHELESIGTMHILNACAAVRIQKLIVASTTAVYGPMPRHPHTLKENHELYGLHKIQFIADKVDAEKQIAKFAHWNQDTLVTVLRFAPILGPHSTDFVMSYLHQMFPLRLLGQDPLMQLLSEEDAVTAMTTAIFGDYPGIFNIAPQGVLPLRSILQALHRRGVALPLSLAYPLLNVLWIMKIRHFPPPFLDFLRYFCLADNQKARHVMKFVPRLSTRDALHNYCEQNEDGGFFKAIGHKGRSIRHKG